MPHKTQPIVLHIDDDPDDRELVTQVTRKLNYQLEILPVSNGIEALDLLHKMKSDHRLPCLVILDMNMPGMNGAEVAKKIKDDRILQRIPVILFTTASGTKEDKFFQAHHIPVLTKPTSISLLEDVIKEMLGHCTF